MRLSDLLGAQVTDTEGTALGSVHDVQLTQDGPTLGSFGHALRLDGLLAGHGSMGVRLGYAHGHVQAPWAIAAVLAREERTLASIAWTDVRAVEAHKVTVAPITERTSQPPAGGTTYDAAFDLLDRQLVDKDGLLAGKVDDLSFRTPEDAASYVDAILSGPGALAGRLGGRSGRWLAAIHQRVSEGRSTPTVISFDVVSNIGSELTLSVSREDLGVMAFESWAWDRIISKLPGA